MASGTKRRSTNELALFPVQFPSGTVVPFAGSTAPEGWALCDGSTVSRSTYAALFAAIGEAWGNGDGSTTFHLPDMRGRFLRGSTQGMNPLDAAERDPDYESRTVSNAGGNTGDGVGSVQGDAIRNITGTYNQNFAHTLTVAGAFAKSAGGSFLSAGTNPGASLNSTFDASRVVPTAGDNRPKNANVNYIIKL